MSELLESMTDLSRHSYLSCVLLGNTSGSFDAGRIFSFNKDMDFLEIRLGHFIESSYCKAPDPFQEGC